MENGFDNNEEIKNKRTGLLNERKIKPAAVTLIVISAVLTLICFILIFAHPKGDHFLGGVTYLNVSKREVDTNSQPMSVAQTVSFVEDSVVAIGVGADCGTGSGVIISEDGFVVTNNHVVEGCNSVYIALNDGSVHLASVWATDAKTDLAVLKLSTDKKLNAAVFADRKKVIKGEAAVIIGNPTGELKGSVTSGIISHESRTLSIGGYVMTLIQTDASVNPGNSGGGLFNAYGELVGIVNAKIVATNVEAIGFAIPSDTVLKTVSDLIEYKYVRGRASIGLTVKEYGGGSLLSPTRKYIVVESLYTDDIRAGDQIVSIDGKSLGEYTVDQILHGYSVGDAVEIVVRRDSKTVIINFVLREYVPQIK